MSDTTRTPYVSDEQLESIWKRWDDDEISWMDASKWIRDLYEARLSEVIKEGDEARERADKVGALVNELVDALEKEHRPCPNNCINGAYPDSNGEPEPCQWCWTYGHISDALASAKELGFIPNTPPSNG